MNIKAKSWFIAIVFSVYSILLLVYYPKFKEMMATSGFLMGVFLYLLSNPAYLLLIYYIVKTHQKKFRAGLASLLMIFSLDMLASPRLLVEEIMSTGSSTVTNMGAIAIKAMAGLGISHKFAYYLYYLILPIVFFLVSMELLGNVDFVKKLGKGGI